MTIDEIKQALREMKELCDNTINCSECPFCGGKAKLIAYLVGGINAWAVYCEKYSQDLSCGAQLTSIKSEEDAINAWNRRTTDANT